MNPYRETEPGERHPAPLPTSCACGARLLRVGSGQCVRCERSPITTGALRRLARSPWCSWQVALFVAWAIGFVGAMANTHRVAALVGTGQREQPREHVVVNVVPSVDYGRPLGVRNGGTGTLCLSPQCDGCDQVLKPCDTSKAAGSVPANVICLSGSATCLATPGPPGYYLTDEGQSEPRWEKK